jgi:hypothetical protein
MGFALCHIVPRDLLLRLVTVCLVFSFVFTIAAVAIADDKGSLITVDGGMEVSITGRTITAAGVEVCSKDKRSGNCDDLVGAAQITHALSITSLCVLALAQALICCFVTPCAKTTTQMILALWFITLAPLGLLAASVGVGLGLTVDKATLNNEGYTVGAGMALLIVAMVLSILSVVLTTIRSLLNCNRTAEKDNVLRQRDINGVMQLHAVNDDWERQKQVLAAHAVVVQVEMRDRLAREPLADDADVKAPASDEADDAPPVYVHHRTASHAPPHGQA